GSYSSSHQLLFIPKHLFCQCISCSYHFITSCIRHNSSLDIFVSTLMSYSSAIICYLTFYFTYFTHYHHFSLCMHVFECICSMDVTHTTKNENIFCIHPIYIVGVVLKQVFSGV